MPTMPTMIAKQIIIRQLEPQDLPLLEQMYADFAPPEVALGLPPRDPERRKAWINGLAGGINLIAIHEGRVAGHLALMANDASAEMAVFVHQDFRRRGVASLLADSAVELCRRRKLRSIWVLISSNNTPARQGLLQYGFRTAWESLGEVKMEFTL
jgi:GNAT superfamily N-acetyltransferase